MKIYLYSSGLILSGKAWEIQQKLRDCAKDYRFVSELVHDHEQSTPSFARKPLKHLKN